MNNLLTKHILGGLENREKFQIDLLEWFDSHQRDLPWRNNSSLYKTVISEFMLQQTRVTTVIPYFENWIEKFPDFKSLASAKEEEVLKGWEGLGYYSRARNLHKLSKIVSTWDSFPTDAKSWQSLPGIGPYIAAAITSISFNQTEAVCDGNVVRVLTRILACGEQFKDGSVAQKKLRPHAQKLLNIQRPGDYNQALMELGAIVCHRQSPSCTTCPVQVYCTSGKQGDPERFPVLAKKKKSFQKIKRFWIESNDSLLLQKPKEGENKLVGIYELPKGIELEISKKGKILAVKKRTIGQVEFEESIYLTSLTQECDLNRYNMEWIKWENLNNITLSGPHRKWIEELKFKNSK
ncbi:MAG: A/G-specific adenine glycosylase [Opitutales bacterium]|nr:A/G-specific adenine glycosylase [Opitutales bacterium]